MREVVRDEQVMRRRILAALADGPLTVPETGGGRRAAFPRSDVLGHGPAQVRLGRREKEVTDEGYYRYQVAEREGS